MGTARNWFNTVRKKWINKSQRDITILHSPSHNSDISIIRDLDSAATSSRSARRASRALRSLVKLQAVGRGVYIRKQAQIALQCMHALVRLQVRVRARQLLTTYSHHHHR
ncbi:hypothetical protein COLO4_22507 [Corchorus olitorius]|uniref:IQ motif, EF-hand binding site n=1 Tax=Corchorus olitorius TaxID=93759 RepID=A0A1R3ILJ7_9ROSI|nr:hypothetical protein COLO4_22507 [Corchorus olitorius]